MSSAWFIEPLDVVILRGNKLFGDPGSFAQSLLPPWPSVAAGALRSWLLAHDGVDLQAFANNALEHPTLGRPEAPGSFTLTAFDLARRENDAIEVLRQPPADLFVYKDEGGDIAGVERFKPARLIDGIESSSILPQVPVLAQDERRKPVSGWWLTGVGWSDHLAGKPVGREQLVFASDLYAFDLRVSVGLDEGKRSARDGALFSTQTVAMKPRVGFLAEVTGTELPNSGMLRFGGDGRAAAVSRVNVEAVAGDLAAIAQSGRCRIVLTTPGLFENGWRFPGMALDGRFELEGVRGHVVAAAVPRAGVISGFDLAGRFPKPAERVAPAGSVYWVEDLEADAALLDKLASRGLWTDAGYHSPRRAEGFNRFVFASY